MDKQGFLFPVSFAQERIWFVAQVAPDAQIFNTGLRLYLRGSLNIEALEWALGVLTERHETLRTVFPARDGKPLQAVLATSGLPLEKASLSAMDGLDIRRAVEEYVAAEAARPFDLATGPWVRA